MYELTRRSYGWAYEWAAKQLLMAERYCRVLLWGRGDFCLIFVWMLLCKKCVSSSSDTAQAQGEKDRVFKGSSPGNLLKYR